MTTSGLQAHGQLQQQASQAVPKRKEPRGTYVHEHHERDENLLPVFLKSAQLNEATDSVCCTQDNRASMLVAFLPTAVPPVALDMPWRMASEQFPCPLERTTLRVSGRQGELKTEGHEIQLRRSLQIRGTLHLRSSGPWHRRQQAPS